MIQWLWTKQFIEVLKNAGNVPFTMIVTFGKARSPVLILHVEQSILHEAVLVYEGTSSTLQSYLYSESFLRPHFKYLLSASSFTNY